MTARVWRTRTPILALMATVLQYSMAAAAPTPAPLPRLAVRKDAGGRGEFFCTATGKPVLWRGANHCRFVTYPGDKTFSTLYSAAETEAVFAKMRAAGYNVVRVFLRKGDITAPDGTATLNAGYMENVVDFIRRGAAHGVYTYLTIDWVPDAYVAKAGEFAETEPPVQGTNLHYFSERFIQAYGRCWADVLRRVKAEDPALLAAISGLDLKNEIAFSWSHPFDQREGSISVPELGRFDLSSPTSRKALADGVAARWVRKVSALIREVDPHALISVSCCDLPADGSTLALEMPAHKHINFDLAAVQDACDFLDTHFYVMPAWISPAKEPYRGYQDWRLGKGASRLRLDKPLVIGEIGVFRETVDYDLAKAMWLLADFQQNTYQHLNARGWLHWLWDIRGFESFWSDEWLLARDPDNWIGSPRRPDPGKPPVPYTPLPEAKRTPPPAPLGTPGRFRVSQGATLTQTPYGYLLGMPEDGAASARRLLDTSYTKSFTLQAVLHYDRAKNRCGTLRVGDSVANKWVQVELIWDGARCRLGGGAVESAEQAIRRPPIPPEDRMFCTRLELAADLAARKLTITFNGAETLTKELVGLNRIDAIEIARVLDARTHVAITEVHGE